MILGSLRWMLHLSEDGKGRLCERIRTSMALERAPSTVKASNSFLGWKWDRLVESQHEEGGFDFNTIRTPSAYIYLSLINFAWVGFFIWYSSLSSVKKKAKCTSREFFLFFVSRNKKSSMIQRRSTSVRFIRIEEENEGRKTAFECFEN